jgi:hypothetical protein
MLLLCEGGEVNVYNIDVSADFSLMTWVGISWPMFQSMSRKLSHICLAQDTAHPIVYLSMMDVYKILQSKMLGR